MNTIFKGEIIINNDFVLCKGLSKFDFKRSNIFDSFVEQNSGNYTRYYSTKNHIETDRVILSLYFNSIEILEIINISLVINDDIPQWENWTLDNEMNLQDTNEKWLKRLIGNPPYDFSWGSILSKFDARAGSSYIEIRYKY